MLSGHKFLAFHNAVVPQLDRISYLRSQFAPRPFPLTCTAHGFSQQTLLWDIFTRLLLTPALPCDSVVCTSNAARQAFQNILDQLRAGLQEVGMTLPLSPVRLDLIPLGVDTDLYQPRDKRETRHILGLPQDKLIILHFGRIDHITKGDWNPLLIAFRQLLNKHGDKLALMLAGNISDAEIGNIQRSAATLGCSGHVLIRPRPPLVEGPLYYSAADIFVSLSETLQESFGLSPLEAMASGLPAVVSDWSGYRETVLHDVTGFHAKTYWAKCDQNVSLSAPLHGWRQDHVRLSQSVAVDIDQIITFLDLLIADPEKRKAMGEAARKHVLKNYRWKTVISQYAALWNELSEIAAGLPQENLPYRLLQQPQYFRNYSHFATQTITGAERLSLTTRGLEAYRNPNTIAMHSEMQHVLNRKVLLVIMKFVKMTNSFKLPATVADICEKISPKHHLTQESMLAHVMWLLKYGYLRI